MNEFLNRTYLHNTVRDYLIATAFVFVSLLLVKAFKRFILTKVAKIAENTETNLDDSVVQTFSRYGIPIINISIIYFAFEYLRLSAKANVFLSRVTTVAITVLVILFVSSTLVMLLKAYLKKRHQGSETLNEFGALKLIINAIVWFIGLGFLFDNLGYDLTAVIAGLGVGGIAVALAAQNILGDLFNYFVIFLDKPFEIGDFVVIDDKNGVIENIGVKTTRIKTLSGEQLIFSNSDLTSSRIHNFKRMQRRRVLFKIGVTYQTSYEDLAKIPEVLKSIILEQSPVEFDRAHFVSYGDSSLDFEIVYYVLDSSYNVYMDIQQAINLGIYKSFAEMGVEIAYPTRTLFVVNEQQGGQQKDEKESPLLV
ncbi:mechanosensitive ion channel protein MscS [Pontibacter sp. SGAir0037]|nr:mechanosensitive ion channel protein MscS [Pontibacter sp. SGAir0037]